MACGDGPVDAIFLAIEAADRHHACVARDFSVHSVTVGKDAQGEVMVEVEHAGAGCIAAAACRPTASRPAPRHF